MYSKSEPLSYEEIKEILRDMMDAEEVCEELDFEGE